jgi:cell division protein FtsB
MAASIIRLEQENQELRAEVALLREEQIILKAKL